MFILKIVFFVFMCIFFWGNDKVENGIFFDYNCRVEKYCKFKILKLYGNV